MPSVEDNSVVVPELPTLMNDDEIEQLKAYSDVLLRTLQNKLGELSTLWPALMYTHCSHKVVVMVVTLFACYYSFQCRTNFTGSNSCSNHSNPHSHPYSNHSNFHSNTRTHHAYEPFKSTFEFPFEYEDASRIRIHIRISIRIRGRITLGRAQYLLLA